MAYARLLPLSERVLESEVLGRQSLDDQLNLRTLGYDEWQAKVKSDAYRAIERKLAGRSGQATTAVVPAAIDPSDN